MDVERLDPVSTGGLHVVAHNSERSAINQLSDLVDQLQNEFENLGSLPQDPDTSIDLPPNYYSSGRYYFFDSGPELPYDPEQEYPPGTVTHTNVRDLDWETANVLPGSILLMYTEYGLNKEYRALEILVRNNDPAAKVFDSSWGGYYQTGYDLLVGYENGTLVYPLSEDVEEPPTNPEHDLQVPLIDVVTVLPTDVQGSASIHYRGNSAHMQLFVNYQALTISAGENVFDEDSGLNPILGLVLVLEDRNFLISQGRAVGHMMYEYEDGGRSAPIAVSVESVGWDAFEEGNPDPIPRARMFIRTSDIPTTPPPSGKTAISVVFDLNYVAGYHPIEIT